jgi:prepilin-type N-terminal cleavage/methylation domain-containing protein
MKERHPTPSRYPRRSAGGFTLLEVVVAMTIFGVGIVGVVETLAGSADAATAALREAEAVRLAERVLLEAVASRGSSSVRAEGRQDGLRWTTQRERVHEGLGMVTARVTWTHRGQRASFDLRQAYVEMPGEGG